jgi:hypothetical protein
VHPDRRCHTRRRTPNLEGFLDAIGQPADRDGAAYTYCAEGEDGETVVLDVVFDEHGRADAIRPGTSGVEPVGAGGTHDHDVHEHDVVGVPLPGRRR